MSDRYYVSTGGVGRLDAGLAVPKFALANIAAATTDGAIITAVTGRKIRVLDVKIGTITLATTVTFNSKPAGAGTAISCLFNAPVGVAALGFNQLGHFETNLSEGLTATTGAGNTVAIQITYIEV
jgi:hypothetical protein